MIEYPRGRRRLAFRALHVSMFGVTASLVAGAGGPMSFPPASRAGLLAVSWNDVSADPPGGVRSMRTTAPWPWTTPRIGVGTDQTLRYSGGRLYAVSRTEGFVTVIDAARWRVLWTWSAGADCPHAMDIAVVDRRRAYISCADATHLRRIDPETGALVDVVDLSAFADGDGRPDLGWMALYAGRVFVQIRRFDDEGGGFASPAMIAVVDVATEQLVDCDASRPGIQAIELEGRSPKFKMQVVPQTRKLFVGATGGWMDAGGIEVVNLDTLRSDGLVIREADDQTGADVGAFVMVTPSKGYLVFSTDLLLSSHLHQFDIETGTDPAELHVELNYFVPHMAFDPATNQLFVPEGGWGQTLGVHVFNATTGVRLTSVPTATSGNPVDLELIRPVLVAEAVSDEAFDR